MGSGRADEHHGWLYTIGVGAAKSWMLDVCGSLVAMVGGARLVRQQAATTLQQLRCERSDQNIRCVTNVWLLLVLLKVMVAGVFQHVRSYW